MRINIFISGCPDIPGYAHIFPQLPKYSLSLKEWKDFMSNSLFPVLSLSWAGSCLLRTLSYFPKFFASRFMGMYLSSANHGPPGVTDERSSYPAVRLEMASLSTVQPTTVVTVESTRSKVDLCFQYLLHAGLFLSEWVANVLIVELICISLVPDNKTLLCFGHLF